MKSAQRSKVTIKILPVFSQFSWTCKKSTSYRAMKKKEEHEKSLIKRGLIFTYGPVKGLNLNKPQLSGTAYEHLAYNQQTILQNAFPVKKCAGKVCVQCCRN
jgi:hypothetical protein